MSTRAMVARGIRANRAHNQEVTVRSPLRCLPQCRYTVLADINDFGQVVLDDIRLRFRRKRGSELGYERGDALADDLVRAVRVRDEGVCEAKKQFFGMGAPVFTGVLDDLGLAEVELGNERGKVALTLSVRPVAMSLIITN
jgi:hypothetical protein